jgi:hypothetical protein
MRRRDSPWSNPCGDPACFPPHAGAMIRRPRPREDEEWDENNVPDFSHDFWVALVVLAMVSGIRLHYIFIIYSLNLHLRDWGGLGQTVS